MTGRYKKYQNPQKNKKLEHKPTEHFSGCEYDPGAPAWDMLKWSCIRITLSPALFRGQPAKVIMTRLGDNKSFSTIKWT